MSHQLVIPDEHRVWFPEANLQEYGLKAPPKGGGPKVLLYDIETAPYLTWNWHLFKANAAAIERDTFMLSFSYKWLGAKGRPKLVALNQDEYYDPEAHDDAYAVLRLWQLFEEADAVVAHNGDKFDQKKANDYFTQGYMAPPAPYLEIDTYKEAKRYWNYGSYSLDNLSQHLNLGKKLPHRGIQMWLDCMAGDEKAWREMGKYNVHDVELLEGLFYRLLPWIGMPGKLLRLNRNLWQDEGDRYRCTNCGSPDVHKRGPRPMSTGWRQRWQCNECGHYGQTIIRGGTLDGIR